MTYISGRFYFASQFRMIKIVREEYPQNVNVTVLTERISLFEKIEVSQERVLYLLLINESNLVTFYLKLVIAVIKR